MACNLVRVIAHAAWFCSGAYAYRPSTEHPGAATTRLWPDEVSPLTPEELTKIIREMPRDPEVIQNKVCGMTTAAFALRQSG